MPLPLLSTDIDDCINATCKDEGDNYVCKDGVNGYKCVCAEGYSEPNCTDGNAVIATIMQNCFSTIK